MLYVQHFSSCPFLRLIYNHYLVWTLTSLQRECKWYLLTRHTAKGEASHLRRRDSLSCISNNVDYWHGKSRLLKVFELELLHTHGRWRYQKTLFWWNIRFPCLIHSTIYRIYNHISLVSHGRGTADLERYIFFVIYCYHQLFCIKDLLHWLSLSLKLLWWR